jgi:hypothetical protein
MGSPFLSSDQECYSGIYVQSEAITSSWTIPAKKDQVNSSGGLVFVRVGCVRQR